MPTLHKPSEWEEEFLKQLSNDDIHELLLVSVHCTITSSLIALLLLVQAANYLDVKGLMDILCHSVANMIRGKAPEQIRRTFKAHNPSYSPPPDNPS